MAELLKPLGLHNRKAKVIKKLSTAILEDWNSVLELPGVGKYAADSYRIFIDGYIDIEPTDKELKKYKEWAINERWR